MDFGEGVITKAKWHVNGNREAYLKLLKYLDTRGNKWNSGCKPTEYEDGYTPEWLYADQAGRLLRGLSEPKSYKLWPPIVACMNYLNNQMEVLS